MLQRYFHNVGLLVVVQVLLSLKGLVLIPLLTKAFGAVDYGIWAQVSVVVGLLAPLMVMGTDSAVVRFLPSATREEKRQGLSTILVYGVLVSGVVALLLWAASEPLASAFFEHGENAIYVTLCGLVILTQMAFNAIRDWYRIEDQAGMWATTNALQAALVTGVGVWVAVTGSGVVVLIVLMIVIDAVLCLAFLTDIARRHGVGRPRVDLLRRYLRFGVALMPVGYAAWILNASNRLFLVRYGGLGDIGVYSVVYTLGYTFINTFFNPIWLMYPARASELYDAGDLQGLRRVFHYSIKAAFVVLVPVMVGFTVLAVPIMRLVAAEEFARGGYLVPIVTLGYVFLMVGSYWSVSLGLAGRPGRHTVNMFIAAFCNILLNLLLIPRWGIAGAAVATAASFALLMGISIWAGSRYITLRVDWSFLAKVVSAAALMSLVLLPLRSGEGVANLLACVGIGFATYVLGLVFVRAVSADEWRAGLRLAGLEWLSGYRLVRIVTGIQAPAP